MLSGTQNAERRLLLPDGGQKFAMQSWGKDMAEAEVL